MFSMGTCDVGGTESVKHAMVSCDSSVRQSQVTQGGRNEWMTREAWRVVK